MNKISLAILLLFCVNICYSQIGITQIGINTSNPQGILHLDGRSSPATTNPDTGVPSVLQQSDDVTILSNGNVGIGTTNPSVKLDIRTGGTSATPIPGFKLVDGTTELEGKVLTSMGGTNLGTGRWERPGFSSFTNIPGFSTTLPQKSGEAYSGMSIDFKSPGTYLVVLAIAIQTQLNDGTAFIAQILPSDKSTTIPPLWSDPINRYPGSCETTSYFLNSYHRIYFKQTLEIPAGKTVGYIWIHFVTATTNSVVMYAGTNALPDIPQLCAGSFVRISE